MRRRNSSPAALRSKSSSTIRKTNNGNLTRRASTNSLPKKRKLKALQNPSILRTKIGKLAFSSVKSPIHLLDSGKPGVYEASFWRNDKGPAIFLNNLKNSDKTTFEEIKNDFDQIKKETEIYKKGQDDRPVDIYIKANEKNELDELIDNINNQFSLQGNQHYTLVEDSNEPSVIHLQLQTQAPSRLSLSEFQYDDLSSEDIIIQQESYNYDDDLDSEDIIIQPRTNETEENSKTTTKPPPRELVRQNAQLELVTTTEQITNNQQNISTAPPVPTVKEFKKAMGQTPHLIGSQLYKNINTALNEYHKAIENYGNILKEDGDSQWQLDQAKVILEAQAQELIEKTNNYLSNTQSVKGTKEKSDFKLSTVESLKAIVENADHNQELEKKRAAYWTTLNPLTDNLVNTDADEVVLGVGAQGVVKAVTYQVDLGNGIENFVAGRKLDSPDWNDEGAGIGISKDAPKQSYRGVLSYRIAKMFKMNVVPRTFFMVQTDPKTGKKALGQAIEVVHGTEGQIKSEVKVTGFAKESVLKQKAVLDKGEPQKESYNLEVEQGLEAYTKDLDTYKRAKDNEEGLKKFDFDKEPGEVYEKKELVVDIDYTKAIIQKELAETQVLDNVIGHADRHPGNWIFEGTGPNNITGVRAIDNDDTNGHLWKVEDLNVVGKPLSKTPGIPPFVDIQNAIDILNVKTKDLENISKDSTLTKAERAASKERLKKAQKAIKEKVKSGEIASLGPISGNQLKSLSKLSGVKEKVIASGIKIWGQDTIDAHTEDNSYLGKSIVSAQIQGTTAPVFK